MTKLDQDRLGVAIGAGALLCALLTGLLPDPVWLRIPFALPLMFLLPGWALWRAIDLGDRNDPIRAGTYAVGLSLAVSVLAGVALAAASLLSALSFSFVLGAITAGAAAVAVARARDAERPARQPSPSRMTRNARTGALVAVGLSLLLIGGAIGLARTPLPVPDDRGYTELSFGPTARGATSVDVRVASSEARTREFTLRIAVPGREAELRRLTLAPGESIEEPVRFGASAAGTLRVELLEPTSDGFAVYRRIRLGLPPTGPAPAAQEADDQP